MSILGAIGLSGGFGLANAGLSYLAQREQNKAMLQANRETNEQNYKIWQEQLAWNRENYAQQVADNRENWQMQFDATNAYNDPSAQVARFEEAGLNPFLMMNGQGSVATAGSGIAPGQMPGATPPAMQAPPIQAFQSPLLTALQQGLASSMQISSLLNDDVNREKTRSDIGLNDSTTRLNSTIAGLNLTQTEYMKELNKFSPELLWYQKETAYWNERYLRDTHESRVKSQEEIMLLQTGERILKTLQVEEQAFLSEYFEPMAWAQCASMIQAYANMVADGKLKDKEAQKLVSAMAVDRSIINANNANASVNNALAKLYGQDFNLRRPDELLANEQTNFLQNGLTVMPTGGDDKTTNIEFVRGKELLRQIAIKTYQNQVAEMRVNQFLFGFQEEQLEYDNDFYRDVKNRKFWNWLDYGSRFLGDVVRNTVGGVLAPYDGVNQISKSRINKPTPRPVVGFR